MKKWAMLVSLLVGMCVFYCGFRAGVSQRPANWALPVVRVVDGDTFDVLAEGKAMRVRDLQAPERGEPGFDDATDALRDLVGGKEIGLSFGGIDARRHIFGYPVGPFGRLLAHVTVEHAGRELDVKTWMIEQGYAKLWVGRKGRR